MEMLDRHAAMALARKNAGKHYVYVLYRADGDYPKPFYVGKGFGGRIGGHERQSELNRGKSHKSNVIRKLRSDGIGVLYQIVEFTESEHRAFWRERFLISLIGRSDTGMGPLTNVTDGGEGASGAIRTPEMRAHLSAVKSGKKQSEEHKRACREAKANNPDYIEKMREHGRRSRGRKISAEHLAAMIDGNKKFKRDEAWRKKHSEALRGHKKPNSTGHKNSVARKCLVNNIEFGSVADASRATGMTVKAINYKIQKKTDGFAFLEASKSKRWSHVA